MKKCKKKNGNKMRRREEGGGGEGEEGEECFTLSKESSGTGKCASSLPHFPLLPCFNQAVARAPARCRQRGEGGGGHRPNDHLALANTPAQINTINRYRIELNRK